VVSGGIKRGFVVVIDTVSYEDGDFVHDAICHTQIIGKGGAISKLKYLCQNIN